MKYQFMKPLFIILFTLISSWVMAQKNDFDISTDENTGHLIWQGQFDFATLAAEPSFEWMRTGAKNYHPDTAIINLLKEKLPVYQLVIVMGTWCSDAQALVPQLYALLQKVHYPVSQCQLFGTNRAKETKYVEHKLYHISKVPTIIVKQGPQEIGRIEEVPKESLEKNMLAIILHHENNNRRE